MAEIKVTDLAEETAVCGGDLDTEFSYIRTVERRMQT